MAPKLTLYRMDGACSLVPHILLHELGIPFTAIRMILGPQGFSAADGSLSEDAYREINPAGFVPALQLSGDSDDGESEVITENPAILTYIASLAPQKEDEILGKPGLERAKVYQWLCWLSGTLHGYGYGAILRPARFSDDASAHAGIVERGRNRVEECYARIETHLEGKRNWEHMVGETFTVVDLNVYIFFEWGQRNGFDMVEQYPAYGRLVKAVEKMKSVKATLKAEGIQLRFSEGS